MAVYTVPQLIDHRKQLAMRVCGILDEEEIGGVDPISYSEMSNGQTFVTVWLFGNKKIFEATIELQPGDFDDPDEPHGQKFYDVYRFKNINDIRVDDYGCVITLNTGKKLELKPECIEGKDSFNDSAHGLVSLWDDYDD